MPRFDIHVRVMPRPTLLDPQGQAVEHALESLGFKGLDKVRVGKALNFYLDRPNKESAAKDAESMCSKLLANPVTEDFTVTIEEAAG
ncbi:MAG: phosphoribosylformylglycinamidine synthase subunit PurS [Gemmatimonadota bacterium]|nr:phosphoribosylformylglycinamidine synthase subunit PurS [Gemmatimonadota bacterium]MDH5805898.1 phosphoribosylformylglycinamidine synthase subunit PurS [Gemmatimonadota bacterium]